VEVQPTGNRLLGLGVDDGQQQLSVGRAAARRLKEQGGQAEQ
jgi:hypothetical protein